MDFMLNQEYEYPSGWLSLMSSCRYRRDRPFGERVYGRIKQMFADDAITMNAASLLMSHLFASQNEFERQRDLREEMKANGWSSQRGTSELYVDGEVFVFEAGAGVDDIYYNN